MNHEQKLFEKHAKTFSLAAKLFRKQDRRHVASFYAFCRTLDDLVDQANNPTEAQKILRKVQLGELTQFPQMAKLVAEKKVSPHYLSELALGLQEDLFPKTYTTIEDLLPYCMRVASTVGVIMCQLLGPISREALPHAIDLGIAMQLTNIARDVYEDANQGRIYLPVELFPEGFLSTNIAEDCKKILTHYPALAEPRQKLLSVADRFYASGYAGTHYLPIRARLAIVTAAAMYREIGQECMRDSSRKRAVVPITRKLICSMKAISLEFIQPPSSRNGVKSSEFYREMVCHYGCV